MKRFLYQVAGKFCLLLFSLFGFNTLTAQDFGKNWTINGVKLDFEPTTVNISQIKDSSFRFSTYYANACISDEQGNFQFYTNGIKIINKLGNVMDGGNQLNQPLFIQHSGGGVASTITQGDLIIPKGNQQYYLFHCTFSDSSENACNLGLPGCGVDLLYYSVIDMSAHNEEGKVIVQNQLLDSLDFKTGGMTAVKHANGRDYWLIKQQSNKWGFYKYLVTPDSIYGPYYQLAMTGSAWDYHVAFCKFNLEGNILACKSPTTPMQLFHFDRCSGDISPWRTLGKFPDWDGTMTYGSLSMEFSPTGRYLYMTSFYMLYQYDLWASNIDSSRVFIKRTDTFNYDNYFEPKLAPNGKIYVGAWAGITNRYSVINYPDSPGIACGFQERSFVITGSIDAGSIPNMINYKLGKLVGSGCDTINSIRNEELGMMDVRVFPNPARSKLTIALSPSFRARNEREISALFTNLLGERIHEETLTQAEQEVDVSGWCKGVYFVSFRKESLLLGNRKIVIEN